VALLLIPERAPANSVAGGMCSVSGTGHSLVPGRHETECIMELPAQGAPVLVLKKSSSISGLVVEYIVAIDVTRVRFPADAFLLS
jgi:hypothetical protein